MRIDPTFLDRFRFPGRAGTLQAAGSMAALVNELGDNYGLYHERLAQRLVVLGPLPDPPDRDAGDAARRVFIAKADAFYDVFRAENVLRHCRAYRNSEVANQALPGDGVGLADEQHRLISAETGVASGAGLDTPRTDAASDGSSQPWQ